MTAKTALLVLLTTLVAATIATPVDPERTEVFRFLRAYGFLRDGGGSLSSDNATSLRRALSLFQEYYRLPGVHTYANRENGDVCPAAFEGPGGALAHAFFPTGTADFTSEVHVDDEELWHVYLNKNPSNKYHLLLTLTHEVGHTLGLQHSMRNDSVMFPYIPDNELQYPVKLSVEDILAIQNLYGSHDDGDYPAIPATPATTAAPATTDLAPTDPSHADLCALRRLDVALIMNRRLYISNRRNLWSIDLIEKRYGKPMTLTEYATFLPSNFVHLSAAYQRPSGDLALFADDKIYLAEYPNLKLKPGWPRFLHSIGFPRNARINAVINAHSGRTYAIYDDDKVAEIDECRSLIIKHAPLKDIFPGIPSAITSALRYVDGNLYFFTKRQFYAFNEFKNIVTSAGPFDPRVLGIECPTDGLLRQLRDLLGRIYRLDDATESVDEDD
ncbi:stromelysin-2-like [Cataglyphis hispanica]|uniref:stromelysin-2-like n=1 Tax=Cataglyphis hispanica TaxID=1086592 RepID=UPI00217F883D|nr:stromelysin-2-like [Cataglyphis hispanica]